MTVMKRMFATVMATVVVIGSSVAPVSAAVTAAGTHAKGQVKVSVKGQSVAYTQTAAYNKSSVYTDNSADELFFGMEETFVDGKSQGVTIDPVKIACNWKYATTWSTPVLSSKNFTVKKVNAKTFQITPVKGIYNGLRQFGKTYPVTVTIKGTGKVGSTTVTKTFKFKLALGAAYMPAYYDSADLFSSEGDYSDLFTSGAPDLPQYICYE